jgi:transcriptional regulator NrdR family protein
MSIRCPSCDKTESSVVDSRNPDGLDYLRRRRHCDHCGHRFTTYETLKRPSDPIPEPLELATERADLLRMLDGIAGIMMNDKISRNALLRALRKYKESHEREMA